MEDATSSGEVNRALRIATDSLLPGSPWEDVQLSDVSVLEIIRLYILSKKYTHLDGLLVTLFSCSVYDLSLPQKLDILRFLSDELILKEVCFTLCLVSFFRFFVDLLVVHLSTDHHQENGGGIPATQGYPNGGVECAKSGEED